MTVPCRIARLLRASFIPLILCVALFGTGCSLQIPSDPDGTLDRVSGGVLRVGGSVQDGLLEEDDGRVSGPLATIVEEFAASVDARVEWSVGGEQRLVKGLTLGDLDLVVGGLTEDTPWVAEVGTTRGYDLAAPGADTGPIVLLVPPGENRFLAELERFLDEQVG